MYHTRALVLRKDEWREADVLLAVFSERFGKICLIAQGARKHGAKLQGHLEVGSISAISFVSGRNGYRLTGARLIQFFPGIRQSWLKLEARAAILASLDRRLLEETERAEEFFLLLENVLLALEAAASALLVRRLVIWFQLRLFDLLGLLPPSDSPEAQQFPNLFIFGRQALEEVRGDGFSDNELEGGFADLLRVLDGAFAHGSATPRFQLTI